MNPLELLQLQRNRDRIVKAAARELDIVRLCREQLHIDLILRRLDELEDRLARTEGAPAARERERVSSKITVYRP